MVGVALVVALAAPPAVELETVAAAVRRAPAWEVTFTQRYVPVGFTRGSEETGTLLLRPPDGVRFAYANRVFAVLGTIARLVDLDAGSCEAARLTTDTLDRLPLSAVLDPGAARATFAVEAAARTLTLTPHEASDNPARIVLHIGADGLPTQVVVHDVSGDRNEFRLLRWRRRDAPADTVFAPSLPGLPPCQPTNE